MTSPLSPELTSLSLACNRESSEFVRKRLVRNAFRAYVNAVDAHACRRMRRAREFANCMWNNQDGFKVRYNDYPRGHYIYFMLFVTITDSFSYQPWWLLRIRRMPFVTPRDRRRGTVGRHARRRVPRRAPLERRLPGRRCRCQSRMPNGLFDVIYQPQDVRHAQHDDVRVSVDSHGLQRIRRRQG